MQRQTMVYQYNFNLWSPRGCATSLDGEAAASESILGLAASRRSCQARSTNLGIFLTAGFALVCLSDQSMGIVKGLSQIDGLAVTREVGIVKWLVLTVDMGRSY
jgi:hypothetical protein